MNGRHSNFDAPRPHAAPPRGTAPFVGGLPRLQTCRNVGKFWPAYLAEHSKAGTRTIHYAGSTLGLIIAAASLLSGSWKLFALLPIAGYGLAWASHGFIERDRPTTLTHRLWRFSADFKMWTYWISGRMPRELSNSGLGEGLAK
jgi:hypothetical protein